MATRYLKLSEKEVLDLAAAMKKKFQWDNEPRSFQLKAVRAQLEGCDIIIQAPTGAGKTAIAAGPHVWPTLKGRITIMISPLLALENEMVHTFKLKYGLHAICVNSENGGCTQAVQKQLLSGSVQILLISPEMLFSKLFIEKLLRQSKFTQNIASVVIDEAHCISHWGCDFRKKYGELSTLRAFLSPKIPFVAMSATLTPRVRRDIFSILQFSKGNYRFVNKGNNRPNVSIVVRSCKHPLNSFKDLDFVLPATITKPSDIPKTWIYVDNISEGEKLGDYLSALLKSRNPELEGMDNIIRPYNARLPPEYRTAAMESFRKGEIRVLICTEAAGMGCDIPDIDVVVQWRVPATLSHLVQRAGRVARGAGHVGLAVLLVERSIYKDASPAPPPELNIPIDDVPMFRGLGRGEVEGKDALELQAAEETHHVIPDLDTDDHGLRAFIFSRTCRRKVWLLAFEATQENRDDSQVPCCDICAPELFKRVRPPVHRKEPRTSKVKLPTRGRPDPKARAQLKEWRCRVYARDHRGAFYSSKAILDDNLVEILTSYGPLTRQQATHLLSEKWPWWNRHGNDLVDYLLVLPIEAIPTGAETKSSESSALSAPSTNPKPSSAPLKSKKPRKAISKSMSSTLKMSIKTRRHPPKRAARPKLTASQQTTQKGDTDREKSSQEPVASGSSSTQARPTHTASLHSADTQCASPPLHHEPTQEESSMADSVPTALPTIHSQEAPPPTMLPPPYPTYLPHYYSYFHHHHSQPSMSYPYTHSSPPRTQTQPGHHLPQTPGPPPYPPVVYHSHLSPYHPPVLPHTQMHPFPNPYQYPYGMHTRAPGPSHTDSTLNASPTDSHRSQF